MSIVYIIIIIIIVVQSQERRVLLTIDFLNNKTIFNPKKRSLTTVYCLLYRER